MFVVGLTGGIASGKTTVSDLFASLGATVVDTDIGARAVVAPGQTGLDAIVRHFGKQILKPDGTLDRAALRQRVFDEPEQREWLESLLHPLIIDWARQRITEAAGPYVVLVIPLLVESGALRELLSRVLVVDVPEHVQVSRLQQRDGSSESAARAILRTQARRDQRLAIADDVIENTSEQAVLRARVETLHQHYLSLAANVGDNA